MALEIPQGILDALNAALQAKVEADQAQATKVATAAAVTAKEAEAQTLVRDSKAADAQAGEALAAKNAALAQRLAELDAVEVAFFRVGGAVPPPAPAP